jgi:hypothetical protein
MKKTIDAGIKTIDGVNLVGVKHVLLRDQASPKHNGLYKISKRKSKRKIKITDADITAAQELAEALMGDASEKSHEPLPWRKVEKSARNLLVKRKRVRPKNIPMRFMVQGEGGTLIPMTLVRVDVTTQPISLNSRLGARGVASTTTVDFILK